MSEPSVQSAQGASTFGTNTAQSDAPTARSERYKDLSQFCQSQVDSVVSGISRQPDALALQNKIEKYVKEDTSNTPSDDDTSIAPTDGNTSNGSKVSLEPLGRQRVNSLFEGETPLEVRGKDLVHRLGPEAAPTPST